MSQAVGAPVRVQLMRWDEIGWGSTSPPSLMDVRAGVDAKGNLVALRLGPLLSAVQERLVQTNAELTGTPLPARRSIARAATSWPTPMYSVPNSRYLLKSLPLKDNWIKAHWMRGRQRPARDVRRRAGDRRARVRGEDGSGRVPDPERRAGQRLDATGQTRDQLLAVLDAVTKAPNWQPRVDGVEPVGRERRHRPRRRLVERRQHRRPRADGRDRRRPGRTRRPARSRSSTSTRRSAPAWRSTPAGSRTRSSAASRRSLSRLLSEQYRYSKTHVTSSDFVSYPILRFKDAPKVTPIVLQWTRNPFTAGSASRWRWPPPPRSRTRSSTRPACGCARRRSRRHACGTALATAG